MTKTFTDLVDPAHAPAPTPQDRDSARPTLDLGELGLGPGASTRSLGLGLGVIPRSSTASPQPSAVIVGNARDSRLMTRLVDGGGRSSTSCAQRPHGIVPKAIDRSLGSGTASPRSPGATRFIPKGGLSTSERNCFVPTLSTLIHRHSQEFVPSGGQRRRPKRTDVDEPWGNRCGQTLSVTSLSTCCGSVWISC